MQDERTELFSNAGLNLYREKRTTQVAMRIRPTLKKALSVLAKDRFLTLNEYIERVLEYHCSDAATARMDGGDIWLNRYDRLKERCEKKVHPEAERRKTLQDVLEQQRRDERPLTKEEQDLFNEMMHP
jgi:hypothetical protein